MNDPHAINAFAGLIPCGWRERDGVSLPALFGRAPDEYQHARNACGLLDRRDRGLLRVRGKDRRTWLHNLLTQDIKQLADDHGAYAFAIDVRGRVQFDLNVLAHDDALWLDISNAFVQRAQQHLEKFLISEDASIEAVTESYTRIGICGPHSPDVLLRLGIRGAAELSPLASMPLEASARLIRHDFAGLLGFELIAPREHAPPYLERLLRDAGVRPIGDATLDVLRVEAGIPWLGRDIDDKTIPPETGQIERGISYKKGCYLGQEIIERMRSHGSLAKRLVRLQGAADLGPLPTPLRFNGQEVGRVTSWVLHPLTGAWIGLGYLRTTLKTPHELQALEPPQVVHASAIAMGAGPGAAPGTSADRAVGAPG